MFSFYLDRELKDIYHKIDILDAKMAENWLRLMNTYTVFSISEMSYESGVDISQWLSYRTKLIKELEENGKFAFKYNREVNEYEIRLPVIYFSRHHYNCYPHSFEEAEWISNFQSNRDTKRREFEECVAQQTLLQQHRLEQHTKLEKMGHGRTTMKVQPILCLNSFPSNVV
jgi:hypothetical protein